MSRSLRLNLKDILRCLAAWILDFDTNYFTKPTFPLKWVNLNFWYLLALKDTLHLALQRHLIACLP
jgi:hypothetical protein